MLHELAASCDVGRTRGTMKGELRRVHEDLKTASQRVRELELVLEDEKVRRRELQNDFIRVKVRRGTSTSRRKGWWT